MPTGVWGLSALAHTVASGGRIRCQIPRASLIREEESALASPPTPQAIVDAEALADAGLGGRDRVAVGGAVAAVAEDQLDARVRRVDDLERSGDRAVVVDRDEGGVGDPQGARRCAAGRPRW